MDNSRRLVACASLKDLAEEVTSCLEFQSPGTMTYLRTPPEDDEHYELHLAPTATAGPEIGLPDDGSQYYPILNSFDLLEAQKAFTQLDALSYSRDPEGRPLISMEGTRAGRYVLIHVYDRPLQSS